MTAACAHVGGMGGGGKRPEGGAAERSSGAETRVLPLNPTPHSPPRHLLLPLLPPHLCGPVPQAGHHHEDGGGAPPLASSSSSSSSAGQGSYYTQEAHQGSHILSRGIGRDGRGKGGEGG